MFQFNISEGGCNSVTVGVDDCQESKSVLINKSIKHWETQQDLIITNCLSSILIACLSAIMDVFILVFSSHPSASLSMFKYVHTIFIFKQLTLYQFYYHVAFIVYFYFLLTFKGGVRYEPESLGFGVGFESIRL